MKLGIFTLGLLMLAGSQSVQAQSFKVLHDTIYHEYSGAGIDNITDNIINVSPSNTDSVTIAWKVQGTDFPSDWQSYSGLVDNKNSYTFLGLWPTGTILYSNKYPQGPGDFHLSTNLSNALSGGCHYVSVRMYNYAVPTDSATATFIVCRSTVGVQNTVNAPQGINLYPNPAASEINLVYDEASDVHSIAVYNVIGKMMNVYRVTSTNSANLNIDNLPAGVYFVRLFNSGGNTVATRKFIKH